MRDSLQPATDAELIQCQATNPRFTDAPCSNCGNQRDLYTLNLRQGLRPLCWFLICKNCDSEWEI